MSWPPKIEKLRKYVVWECKDIPPDLVLAIIKHESGGTPGRRGTVHTKNGTLVDVCGNEQIWNIALGLMQTIPGTIESFNSNKSGAGFATVEDVTGNDERAIRMQIRIGCAYLATANHILHNAFPDTCPASSLSEASDDQIKLVLTGYAVGAGRTMKKMKQAKQEGYSPTFANIKKLFPKWGQNAEGKWINRPLKFAQDVMPNYKANRGGSFTGTRAGDLIARAKNCVSSPAGSAGGMIALAVLLTAAGWAVNRYYKPKG